PAVPPAAHPFPTRRSSVLLPRKYYLELPKLADGPFEGYPRVYLLARELIAHTAGRLDLDTIVDFTTAYQRASTLTIGETWAVPIDRKSTRLNSSHVKISYA